MMPTDRLKVAVWEADRHVHALCSAQQDWEKQNAPILIQEIEHDKERMRLIDQILFRFAKLQDAMGMRLVPATLAALHEPYEEWPMQDRLDRLEQIGILDATSWLKWREIRNRFAHEYPENDALRLTNITAAIGAAKEITVNYQHWRAQLEQRRLVPLELG